MKNKANLNSIVGLLLFAPMVFANKEICLNQYSQKNDVKMLSSTSITGSVDKYISVVSNKAISPLAVETLLKSYLGFNSLVFDSTRIEMAMNDLNTSKGLDTKLNQKIDYVNSHMEKLDGLLKNYKQEKVPLSQFYRKKAYLEEKKQEIAQGFADLKTVLGLLKVYIPKLADYQKQLDGNYKDYVNHEETIQRSIQKTGDFFTQFAEKGERQLGNDSHFNLSMQILTAEQTKLAGNLVLTRKVKSLIYSKINSLQSIRTLIEHDHEFSMSALLLENGLSGSSLAQMLEKGKTQSHTEIPIDASDYANISTFGVNRFLHNSQQVKVADSTSFFPNAAYADVTRKIFPKEVTVLMANKTSEVENKNLNNQTKEKENIQPLPQLKDIAPELQSGVEQLREKLKHYRIADEIFYSITNPYQIKALDKLVSHITSDKINPNEIPLVLNELLRGASFQELLKINSSYQVKVFGLFLEGFSYRGYRPHNLFYEDLDIINMYLKSDGKFKLFLSMFVLPVTSSEKLDAMSLYVRLAARFGSKIANFRDIVDPVILAVESKEKSFLNDLYSLVLKSPVPEHNLEFKDFYRSMKSYLKNDDKLSALKLLISFKENSKFSYKEIRKLDQRCAEEIFLYQLQTLDVNKTEVYNEFFLLSEYVGGFMTSSVFYKEVYLATYQFIDRIVKNNKDRIEGIVNVQENVLKKLSPHDAEMAMNPPIIYGTIKKYFINYVKELSEYELKLAIVKLENILKSQEPWWSKMKKQKNVKYNQVNEMIEIAKKELESLAKNEEP